MTEPPDLHPYAGRWVALLRGEIAGQGLTRQQALDAARDSRPKERPAVRFVPPLASTPLPQLLDALRPALAGAGPVYVVGGALRDQLLGRPVRDLDLTLERDAVAAARRAADYLGGEFYLLDEERGTGRVLLTRPDGERLALDFAMQRGASLEEDQRGRDFTINSLAVDLEDPQRSFDPLGGAQDIRLKRIHACSETAFRDDPLRILRAVRIALELGFQISPETRAWLRESIPALDEASPERRRDEILKILAGRRPAAALRTMEALGILPQVFPELLPLKGTQQSPPHVHDVWEHSLAVLGHLEGLLDLLAAQEHDEEAAGSLLSGLAVMRLGRYRAQFQAHLRELVVPDRRWRGLLFLAALYHDAGKPATRSLDESGRIRFLGHEQESARLLSIRANALKLSNDEIRRVVAVVRHHMRPHMLAGSNQQPSRRAVYRFFRDTRKTGVDICLLGLADLMGTYERTLPQETWARYLDLSRELLENWWERPEESVLPPPLVGGKELIDRFALSQGPLIGELLAVLQEAQAAGEITDAEGAFRLAERHLKKDAAG